MKKLMLTVAGALLLMAGMMLLNITPANAQGIPCGDRGVIVDRLEKVYAEVPVSIGIIENGSLIEIFVSKKGSFTVLITSPNGGSCLVASGEYWELFPTLQVELKV